MGMTRYFVPVEYGEGDHNDAWREVDATDDQSALAQIDPRLLREGERIELIRLESDGRPVHVYHVVSLDPEGRWSLHRWESRS